MIHIGKKIKRSRNGLKLNREVYANINNNSSFRTASKHNDSWCIKHAIMALINFDLNMNHFSNLNAKDFNNEINSFLKRNRNFKKVDNILSYEGKSGYYLMILDEYKQAYVGTSDDIYKRIYRHWYKQKSFDRLIFGNIYNSKISIDSFRPLDTTRIYVWETKNVYSEENELINSFSEKFLCNRTIGGKLDNGITEAINNRKIRNLVMIKRYVKPICDFITNSKELPKAVHLHEIYEHFINYIESNHDTAKSIWDFNFVGQYGKYSYTYNVTSNTIIINDIFDKSTFDELNKPKKNNSSQKKYYNKNRQKIKEKYREKYKMLIDLGHSSKEASQMAGWSMSRIKNELNKQ